jgi:hypothetical protein
MSFDIAIRLPSCQASTLQGVFLDFPATSTISHSMFRTHPSEFLAGPRSRAERVARLDALATLFDTAFLVPGTNIRFGIDALIRLVPAIGDVITTGLALYVVNEARALGAPPLLIARMLANVALDSVVGAVPLVGDAVDVVWRVNRRNVALLLDHLRRTDGMIFR